MSLGPISADLAVPLQTFTNKAFPNSTHTTKTSIEYKPNQTPRLRHQTPVRSQQPASHKSPSGTERVTTKSEIYGFTPTDPTIRRPQTLKRHERAITNSPT